MANNRNQRINLEIQRLISEIIIKDISDPRLIEMAITEVRVTNDLSFAHVFYATDSDLASINLKIAQGLDSAKGIIRKKLAAKLTTFKTPELIFEKDESVAYGNRIDQLINQMNKHD